MDDTDVRTQVDTQMVNLVDVTDNMENREGESHQRLTDVPGLGLEGWGGACGPSPEGLGRFGGCGVARHPARELLNGLSRDEVQRFGLFLRLVLSAGAGLWP